MEVGQTIALFTEAAVMLLGMVTRPFTPQGSAFQMARRMPSITPYMANPQTELQRQESPDPMIAACGTVDVVGGSLLRHRRPAIRRIVH